MEESDKRSQIDVLAVIWQSKLLVVVVTAIFAILSVIWSMSMTDVYRAETLLAPVSDDSGNSSSILGQFSGLASIAGLSLGGVKTDKTTLAIEFLHSRTFLMDFIKRHQLKVSLMAVNGWDKQTDTLVINPSAYDTSTKEWVREVDPPLLPEPTLWAAYEEILELISIERQKDSGLLLISVEYFSPYMAKQWLDWLIADLNKFMRHRDMLEAKNSVTYLEAKLAETSDVNMQQVLFQLIEEQLKTLMLAEVRNEYALSYVDPAIVPEQKYKPRRAVICIIGTFIGGFLSCLFVILSSFRKKSKT